MKRHVGTRVGEVKRWGWGCTACLRYRRRVRLQPGRERLANPTPQHPTLTHPRTPPTHAHIPAPRTSSKTISHRPPPTTRIPHPSSPTGNPASQANPATIPHPLHSPAAPRRAAAAPSPSPAPAPGPECTPPAGVGGTRETAGWVRWRVGGWGPCRRSAQEGIVGGLLPQCWRFGALGRGAALACAAGGKEAALVRVAGCSESGQGVDRGRA